MSEIGRLNLVMRQKIKEEKTASDKTECEIDVSFTTMRSPRTGLENW